MEEAQPLLPSNDKEIIKQSANDAAENLPPLIELSPTNKFIPETDQPQLSDMEVHHHTGHAHGKKTWKTYFWEFIMLFLAVFCGFLAEYKLEHVIEHQREKEFAQALYGELLDDSAVAATKLTSRLEKEKDMDYLSSYFKDSSLANLPKKFYPAYTTSLYLINTYSFEPKDGILNQFRNSGMDKTEMINKN